MRNPIRRSRNIGTANQSHGQDNRMVIASPLGSLLHFPERLEKYSITECIINDQQFRIVTEELLDDCFHACSVEDITAVLAQIPPDDLQDLRLVVLRQPKRKEALLSPVWGRLVYNYKFEGVIQPAVVLEAGRKESKYTWSRKLSVAGRCELEQLRSEGHRIVEDKRSFHLYISPESARQTQLYRTLPHEVGHYVHYLNFMDRPTGELAQLDPDARYDRYFGLPPAEKEQFAERYAAAIRSKLLL